MQIGATCLKANCCEFVVWAPRAEKVELQILAPFAQTLSMERINRGYWQLRARDVAPGSDYRFRIDEAVERPDPASSYQPEGVHGPSRIVDHAAFAWTDRGWRSPRQEDLVIYELHVGTFTPEGTLAAIIPRLATLREMGITAIELMPVAQFPGERNWGYDGASPFAVQNSYGGPNGLKELVNACHGHGLAVILDVVYNHLGPEGNYLRDFGPYFTDRCRTPWGEAVNFDGPGSDEVRRYFIANALHWLDHYHIDALRLDAIHTIFDFSAKTFLQELTEQVRAFAAQGRRRCLLIAENDHNDMRVIRPRSRGGYGLDALWNDDFHHAVHVLITGETHGYYADFGSIDDLAAALREGFVYGWRYSSFRQRRHGSPPLHCPARQLVVCSQNHDQVGNRPAGERLISLAGLEAAKLAAAATFFSPFIPLLFMGEEYGENAAFLYFIDFSDPKLNEAVRRGRQAEFETFAWESPPIDPGSREAYERSKINWDSRFGGFGHNLSEYYRTLIALRRKTPALANLDVKAMNVRVLRKLPLIMIERWHDASRVVVLLNFSRETSGFRFPRRRGTWTKLFDTADTAWSGAGGTLPDCLVNPGARIEMPPLSAALFSCEFAE